MICWVSSTGASSVTVSIGAPDSRRQAVSGDVFVRVGYYTPVRWRKPCNGERTRGSQLKVTPAASMQLQLGGRADNVVTDNLRPSKHLPDAALRVLSACSQNRIA